MQVPAKENLPKDNPLVPKPPSGGGATKLSAGATSVARPSFGKNVPVRDLVGPAAKKRSPVATYATTAAVLVAIGAGVYFGLPYYQKWRAGGSEEAAAAPAKGDGKAPDAAQNQEPPPPPPPPKEVPAVWNMDVAKAEFPTGKVHGKIAGTNFIADLVKLDRGPLGALLTMRQGSGATPDRGVQVYLKLPAGEAPVDKKISVSPTEKSAMVTQVTKQWKPNPRYAAQQKSFTTGFALKLEFGPQGEDGNIKGKIFLSLPDTEQSVVGGEFTFSATPGQEVVAPQPMQVTPQQDPASQDRFNKRYGIRR